MVIRRRARDAPRLTSKGGICGGVNISDTAHKSTCTSEVEARMYSWTCGQQTRLPSRDSTNCITLYILNMYNNDSDKIVPASNKYNLKHNEQIRKLSPNKPRLTTAVQAHGIQIWCKVYDYTYSSKRSDLARNKGRNKYNVVGRSICWGNIYWRYWWIQTSSLWQQVGWQLGCHPARSRQLVDSSKRNGKSYDNEEMAVFGIVIMGGHII